MAEKLRSKFADYHIITITTLDEVCTKFKSTLFLKDKKNIIMLGISGADSFASLIKLIQMNAIEKNSIVVPLTCRLPNFVDDVFKKLAANVKVLQIATGDRKGKSPRVLSGQELFVTWYDWALAA